MKILPLFLALISVVTASVFAEDAKPSATTGAQNVTPDEAEKLLKANPKVVIIDVRTPEEFAQGHIAGSKNLNFQGDDFSEQIKALPADGTYLLHCASGGRSKQALPLLLDRKFPNLYHLNGGFTAWKDAGKPVEKK